MNLSQFTACLLTLVTAFAAFSSPLKLDNMKLNNNDALDGMYPTASDISSDGRYLFIFGTEKTPVKTKVTV